MNILKRSARYFASHTLDIVGGDLAYLAEQLFSVRAGLYISNHCDIYAGAKRFNSIQGRQDWHLVANSENLNHSEEVKRQFLDMRLMDTRTYNVYRSMTLGQLELERELCNNKSFSQYIAENTVVTFTPSKQTPDTHTVMKIGKMYFLVVGDHETISDMMSPDTRAGLFVPTLSVSKITWTPEDINTCKTWKAELFQTAGRKSAQGHNL